MINIDIVIPSYNEELILKTSAQRVLAFCQKELTNYDWKIILLINGSSDNSPTIAQSLAEQNNSFKTVVYPEAGRGHALKKYWLESSADVFIYMDSDLAVELKALPHLIKPLVEQKADLAIGTRFHPQARVKRRISRELISRCYNFLAWLLLKNPQKDLQCGFKAIRHEIFKKLAPYTTNPGWLFDTELITWANKFNYTIAEIPVDWQETRLGQRPSKVNLLSIPHKFIKPLWQLRQRLKKLSKTL